MKKTDRLINDSVQLDSMIKTIKKWFGVKSVQYHVAIDSKNSEIFDIEIIKNKIRNGSITKNTFVWNQGMDNWTKAIDVPELRTVFPVEPPPIPTIITPSKYNSKPSNVGQNIIIEEPYPFKMIFVKGGTFLMGAQKKDKTAPNYDPEACDEESPVHRVTLDDFYIGETQVTQGLWEAVMGDNPSKFDKGDNYPVERVSWNDIVNSFLPKLNRKTGKNFCLPTEAQWEYAARGGNKSKGYKYSGSNNVKDVAVFLGNSQTDGDNYCSSPVKSKSPNELGIYDMSGNGYEWCQDWYDDYTSGNVDNPSGPSYGSTPVSRGGSWEDDAEYCRVSCRDFGDPGYRSCYYGLRLVLLSHS